MLQEGTRCYLLTGRGVLMPGVYLGESTDKPGLLDAESPSGKIYTTRPDAVYDQHAGAVMLMYRRAEELAQQGYEIRVRLNGDFRIFCEKKHGLAGGYIVRRTAIGLMCGCPAHIKQETCKHVLAVCALLHRRAAEKLAAGKTRIASRYTNLAGSIHQSTAG